MKPIEVKPNIYWIGALHPELRIFDDLFMTKKGTTYNSYLIDDEKITIIDTVKAHFTDEFISRIKTKCDPTKIEYIVVNHTEPDHSGALGELLNIAVNAKIIASKTAIIFLKEILNKPFESIEAKDELIINIGKHNLKFFIAPFLHWPDTMFTYIPEDKILFPCDAFGSHFCDFRMFNDLVDDYYDEFKLYFDCLVKPFKKNVLDTIEKAKNLDIEIIAPSHGPILRHNPLEYVNIYKRWSTPKPRSSDSEKHIYILYLSPHGNTKKLADSVHKGIMNSNENLKTHFIHIPAHSLNEILEYIEDADGLLIGTPTIVRDAPKPVWDILSLLSSIPLKPKLLASVFGTYGWSGEAIGIVEERLKSLRIKLMEPGFRIRFVPTDKDLASAEKFGAKFAESIMNIS
jgi:NADH oxidase (H2O-forming)